MIDAPAAADEAEAEGGDLAGIDVGGIEQLPDLFAGPAGAEQRGQAGRVFGLEERADGGNERRGLEGECHRKCRPEPSVPAVAGVFYGGS